MPNNLLPFICMGFFLSHLFYKAVAGDLPLAEGLLGPIAGGLRVQEERVGGRPYLIPVVFNKLVARLGLHYAGAELGAQNLLLVSQALLTV